MKEAILIPLLSVPTTFFECMLFFLKRKLTVGWVYTWTTACPYMSTIAVHIQFKGGAWGV